MEKKKRSFFSGFGRALPIQERINFARHLSIMIKAGLPIFEALKIIKNQALSRTLKSTLTKVIESVGNGQSLADSLQARGNMFGDFFVNVVRVGEASGTLSQNLLYLATELQKAKTLRSKIRSAMVYPMVILVATVAIIILLVFFIFPKILPIFASLNVELPVTTRILIAVTNFLRSYWLSVFGGVLAAIVLFRILLLVRPFRYAVQRLTLFTPVVASLIVHMNVANFTRIMGVLLKSGVRIVGALRITSGTFGNLVYRNALTQGASEIERGEQLAHALTKHRRIFPPLATSLIEIGENTGNLEDNLFYLSEYYTEELDTSIKNLTVFIEPLLLLCMGLLVGFVALAIITPIYSLTEGLA